MTLIGAPDGRGGYQKRLDGSVKQFKRTWRCPGDATVKETWAEGVLAGTEVYYCADHASRPNRNGKILCKVVEPC